jgi:hypothetical protein
MGAPIRTVFPRRCGCPAEPSGAQPQRPGAARAGQGAKLRRTSGRQWEAFRLADLGRVAPWRQRQARDRRERWGGGRRKSFETWQWEWRGRNARSGFEARHLLGTRRGSGQLQLSKHISVDGDVGEGPRDRRGAWRCRRPLGEDRVGSDGTEPVESPDTYSPREGQGGHAGNKSRNDPLRSIPALKRKVVECSLCPLHP